MAYRTHSIASEIAIVEVGHLFRVLSTGAGPKSRKHQPDPRNFECKWQPLRLGTVEWGSPDGVVSTTTGPLVMG